MVLVKKLFPNETDSFLQLIRLFTSDGLKNHTYKGDKYLDVFLENKKNHVLVASINNVVIGGLTAYEMEMYKNDTSEMFLFEIEVKEQYRQQGVGRLLIQALKDVCKQRNIKQIFVITNRNNLSALKLYESTGGIADTESILLNYFL